MSLDHRHMLQRGGVEDKVGRLDQDAGGDPVGIANIHQGGGPGEGWEGFPELAVDLEQGGLRKVDQGDMPSFKGGDLTDKLGANRAAGTSNQHPTASNQAFEGDLVELDRASRQEFLDADVAHGKQGDPVVLREVDDGRKPEQANAVVLQPPQLGCGEARQARGFVKEQDGAGILVPAAQVDQGLIQPTKGLDDADPTHLLTDLAGVQSNNAHRCPGVVATTARLAQVGLGGGGWTDEEQLRCLRRPVCEGFQGCKAVEGTLVSRPAEHPGADRSDHLEDRSQSKHGPAQTECPVGGEEKEQEAGRGQQGDPRQHQGVGCGDIAPG